MATLRGTTRQVARSMLRTPSAARTVVSSSRMMNAASLSNSTTPAAPAPTPATAAAPVAEEEMFILPFCLLAAESHEPTHSHHVATLHLRSYTDSMQNLELLCEFARKSAFALGVPVSGVARLPTRTTLWTVPRSPFVHKKSQENFWRKTHKRAIKVYDANPETVDAWLKFLRIHALPGVGMKAELYRHHELGVGQQMALEAKSARRDDEQVKDLADQIVKREMEQESKEQAQAEVVGERQAALEAKSEQ